MNKYQRADNKHPRMGLDNKPCINPEYWCKLHQVWLSSDDVKRKRCKNKTTFDARSTFQCGCLEKKETILVEEIDMISTIFDGQSIIHPMFIKSELIKELNLTASCVVQELNGNVECTKNRYGYRTIAWLKKQNYNFEKLKLSNLSGSTLDVRQKYFMKNIWLLLDE